MRATTDISDPRSIWRALEAATRSRTAFTLGYLGTADAGGQPHVRAVILREVDPERGTVLFSTNEASAKVAQLRRNPLAALTFYDPDADVQLRLEGSAEIVADERIRRAAWASFGAGTRELFASPLRPGSSLPAVGDAPPVGDSSDADAAYSRFAWVAVHVSVIDAIDLSGEEHLRWRLTKTGDAWHAERLVP